MKVYKVYGVEKEKIVSIKYIKAKDFKSAYKKASQFKEFFLQGIIQQRGEFVK